MPACLNVSPSRLRTGLRKTHGASSALKWRQTEPWPWASVGGLSAAPTVPLSPPNLVLHFLSPKQSGLIGNAPKCVFLLPDDAESGSGQGRDRKQQPRRGGGTRTLLPWK